MRILVLSYDFPYPPSGGSVIRDYNLFKELSRVNELYWIVVLIDKVVDEPSVNEMKKYFKEIKIVNLNFQHSIMRYFVSLFKHRPYILEKFKSGSITKLINDYADHSRVDLVLCDHIYLAQNLPDGIEEKIPVIPNNEDHAFTYYKKMSESGNMIRRLYAVFQWKKLLKYEKGIYEKYGAEITTSDIEKNLINKYIKNVKVCVVKNGVDTEHYFPSGRNKNRHTIIFTGWLRYYPNQQAAIYFAEKIFPIIKNRIPDAKFFIVGKEPPKSVLLLQKTPGITVTGYVEDVRSYLSNSDVAVVPLKIGGGTRLKILEAMSMKIPVVSTKLGAEGLGVTDGVNILLEDDEVRFAQKVIALMSNIDLSENITSNARLFVEENYSWQKIGQTLNDFLEEVLQSYKHKTVF